MKITSKRHPKRQERDFWVYKEDPQLVEKLMAIGVSLKFDVIELLAWEPEDLDAVFNELREEMPE